MLNITLKPHRSYLKANTAEPQKLFAMLKVIPKVEVAAARPALAFAFVVDTSGSMREFADQEQARLEAERRGLSGHHEQTDGKSYSGVDVSLPTKLDQAIEAAHALVDDERLDPGDKTTVIHFDDDAKTLLPLTQLSNKEAAHKAIDSLRNFSGETYMAKGMRCAQQELCDVDPRLVKRVVLLTDGQTFDEPECQPLAGEFAEDNTPIIAIGIGEEYNENLLRDLAATSQGRPYHLRNMVELRDVLSDEIETSVREVVTDLQATVASVKDVTLDSLTRVFPSIAEVSIENQPCRLGNIAAGVETVFVAEFTISGIPRPPSRARLAQVELAGYAPGQGRHEESEPMDMHVSFTTDGNLIAAVDAEVLSYVQQKNVDRMVQEAISQATIDVGQARRTLQVAAGMTQAVGNARMTQMLNDAVDELNKSGTISVGTAKTVALGGRTKTVRAGGAAASEGVPSEEEIRDITGA